MHGLFEIVKFKCRSEHTLRICAQRTVSKNGAVAADVCSIMENRMNERNPLLSPERMGWRPPEWSKLTGLKLGAIYSQIARGQLPTIKVGVTKLIPRRYAVECGLIEE
jgi:hypothetical protein